jgi:hypothetical protein
MYVCRYIVLQGFLKKDLPSCNSLHTYLCILQKSCSEELFLRKIYFKRWNTYLTKMFFFLAICNQHLIDTCSTSYDNVVHYMVARWFILIPIIPIWINFGGPWSGKCWCALRPFGTFCGHLVHLCIFYGRLV